MSQPNRGWWRLIAAAAALAAVVASATILRMRGLRHKPAVMASPARASATVPAAHAGATKPVVPKPQFARTYMDAVRASYPDFPATQPLSEVLDLHEAAHLVFADPVYLSGAPYGELWITRPDAPPTDQVLREAENLDAPTHEHVLREQVVFVHSMPAESARWPAYLVCRSGIGHFELVWQSGRTPLPATHDYDWSRAFSWNEQVVVPSRGGISIFRFAPRLTESYHDLIGPPAGVATTQPATAPVAESPATSAPTTRETGAQAEGASGVSTRPEDTPPTQSVLFWAHPPSDAQGLLAWIPWEQGKPGGRGAARFADGKWTDLLPADGWPSKVVHLVPLLDGSVLQLSRGDGAAVQVSMQTLERAQVDEKKIEQLVEQLSDAEQAKREDAYQQLTRYGPGIWPVLERLFDDQPPEAQARMKQLLREKVQPTIGGMTLLGARVLRTAARLADGGAVFFAEDGVSIPDADGGDPDLRVPAWVSVRPGRAIQLLPEAMTHDLVSGKSRIYVAGNDWVVSDARGPHRFVGNGFVNLVRKDEAAYSEMIGMDHRGRWLFSKSIGTASGGAAPATAATAAGPRQFLLIDPTLPDPTPRLPAWEFTTAKSVGWDKDNWPVAKDGSAYALMEAGWRLLDESKEKMFTRPDEIPPPAAPATSPSAPAASVPATGPATAPVADSAPTTSPDALGDPILVDRERTRYFGGLSELRVVRRDGRQTLWPLPPTANGKGPAHLLQTVDGRLFLFNQPGRLLRIKPMADGPEPFVVEATFTRKVPAIADPTRIWLDPAGRIIFAWGNRMTIFFPRGYIPPLIAEKMPNDPDSDE